MIRVVRGDPLAVDTEALFRSIGADLEPCTALDERVGTRAGNGVQERLRAFGDLPVGGALLTPGGDLAVSFLVHLVLRSHEEPVSEERLRRALRNGLHQAREWEIASVAIPPLGTGAGNLDAEASARVVCAVLREHLRHAIYPREVFLLVGSDYEEEAFTRELARPAIPEAQISADEEVPGMGAGSESP